MTDAGGEFRLDIAPVDVPSARHVGTGTLWAYTPGSLVASEQIYHGALPPALSHRLVLGPPSRAPFEVYLPDAKPAVGAMIEPRSLDRDHSQIPDCLASMIGAETVTDGHGRAVMTAFSPEEINAIRVLAKGYGKQEFSFGPERCASEKKVPTLRPVGRLKGKVVRDRGVVGRRPLRVSGFSQPGDPVKRAHHRVVITEDDGQFEIPEIAEGDHGISTFPRFDFAWWAAGGIVRPASTDSPIRPEWSIRL